MTKVETFDGGLSLRIDPSLIKQNNSQKLENVDVNGIVLRSNKGYTEIDELVGNRIYNFNNNWIHSDNHRDYIEYEGKLYYTEYGNEPKIYVTSEYKLGIDRPTSVLAVDSDGNPIVDANGVQFKGMTVIPEELIDTDINVVLRQLSSGDLPEGVINYKISIVKSDVDVFVIDKSITVSGSDISVSLVFSQNPNVKVRVYREYNSDFKLISELVLDVESEVIDSVNDVSGKNNFTGSAATSTGVRQYCETFYNEEFDFESAPSDFTTEYSISDDNYVLLSNFSPVDDDQVTHRRIYRLGGSLRSMTRICQIPISQDSYADYVTDINAVEILDTHSNYPPSEYLHSLTEMHSIFFGLVDNELRFSEIDYPNVWPPENSFKLRQNGTGLLAIPQGLLVFTESTTYFLSGSNKSKFSLTLVSDSQGCLTNRSCQVAKNSPLWVSYDGICTIQNGYVSVISKPLLGKIDLNVDQSIVYDEQYFILKSDGSLLVLDMRSGFRFYTLKYDDPVKGLAVHDGKLYFSCNGKLCEAFTGDELTLKYISPVFTEGNHSQIKSYNHIFVRSDGSFTLKFFIDDTLVLTSTLEGNVTHNLKTPAEKQNGYSCYFDIEGVGVVYSLSFTPTRGQNGHPKQSPRYQ